MTSENTANISHNTKISLDSSLIFRIESDDWGLLFDPETGDNTAINPVGVVICKNLNGLNTVLDLVEKVKDAFNGVTDQVESDVIHFLQNLVSNGKATIIG